MSKIQNRLKGLQPYLVQLRFPEGNPVVDMVFKKGWHVPQSEVIGSTKGDSEDLNYHMFYGGHDEVELDDILDFIEKVIALNIEREKKHELLKAKAKELQDLFRKNPLSKLQGMKFVLGGEKLVQDMTPDPLDVVDFNIDEQLTEQPQSTSVKKPQPTPDNRPQPEAVESPVLAAGPIAMIVFLLLRDTYGCQVVAAQNVGTPTCLGIVDQIVNCGLHRPVAGLVAQTGIPVYPWPIVGVVPIGRVLQGSNTEIIHVVTVQVPSIITAPVMLIKKRVHVVDALPWHGFTLVILIAPATQAVVLACLEGEHTVVGGRAGAFLGIEMESHWICD